MGTGTRDMIQDCRNAGLLEPDFSLTDGFVATVYRKSGRAFEAVGGKEAESGAESRAESGAESIILAVMQKPLSMSEISLKIGSKKQVTGALKRLVQDLLSEKLIQRTIPDKPNSRLQKYRLTKKGIDYLKKYKQK